MLLSIYIQAYSRARALKINPFVNLVGPRPKNCFSIEILGSFYSYTKAQVTCMKKGDAHHT